jgi:hypothetical protein
MSTLRTLGSAPGSIAGVLGLAALILAAPAATATADKPVPGGSYTYKTGPDFAKIVNVTVGPKGTAATVGWSFKTGNGCTGENGQAISSGRLDRVAIKADGSFHGASEPWKGSAGVKYYRVETRGAFLAGGDTVRISVRQKSLVQTPGHWMRCDGRWLTFRACLSEHGKCVRTNSATAASA